MFNPFIYALLGGILPALVWLAFWLREDKKNPEPRGLIRKTFLLGMLAVVLVLPFQKGVEMIFGEIALTAIVFWAIFEEVFKFCAGYFGGLHTVEDNEPIDPIIYMITAALGFVALENTLFLLGPILGADLTQSIVTGNLRFIGASLLHVVASGIVGVGLAFSFYKSKLAKTMTLIFSLAAAIIFHVIFNMLIISHGNRGTTIAFFMVWGGVVALLLMFEKAKSIAPRTY